MGIQAGIFSLVQAQGGSKNTSRGQEIKMLAYVQIEKYNHTRH